MAGTRRSLRCWLRERLTLPTVVPTRVPPRPSPALSLSPQMAPARIRLATSWTAATTLTNTPTSISLFRSRTRSRNSASKLATTARSMDPTRAASLTSSPRPAPTISTATPSNSCASPSSTLRIFFATPTTPDRIKRNHYGGTLGAPIRHDKTFFFGGYQRTTFRNFVLGSQKVVGQTDIANFLAAWPFLNPANPTGPHLP